MACVWMVAALLVGAMLGWYYGHLMRASIVYWEGNANTLGLYMKVFGLLLGAGGGAALFGLLTSGDNAAFYLAGLGAGGLSAAYIGLPSRWTIDGVRTIVQFSNASSHIADLEQRSRFILAILVPPKTLMREGVDEQQLAQDLEEGADA